jgi:ABC-type transport system substrate-binding protein
MYLQNYKHTILVAAGLFLFLFACTSTDTVTVVQDAPRTGAADRADTETEGEEFLQINIGTIDPVTNLDPLFAENLSTKRVISLIYEGLFTLNADGEPEPALASSYEISENGREYTIRLRDDIFFHDSRAFVTGIGRRLHANDVKWAFERTAGNTVPTYASELLMNVVGYRNYFTEQRDQFDLTRRVVDGVSGIEAVDSRTLRIRLRQADDNFLKKLASPFLSIYPREAVAGTGFNLRSNPVGTGMFSFRSSENGRIILIRSESERFSDVRIQRIDIVSGQNESDLFQKFVRNEIDWIPETGPLMNRQLLTNDGALQSSYAEDFNLVKNDSFRITRVYLNRDSDAQTGWLTQRLRDTDSVNFRVSGEIEFQPDGLPEDESGEADSEYFVTYTDNPVARIVFNELNSALIRPESSLIYLDIYVVIDETALYSRSTDSIHDHFIDTPNYNWLSVRTPVYSLLRNTISGIEPTQVPWQLPVRTVRIENAERRPS